jgi:general nucleoside transport system permease protein
MSFTIDAQTVTSGRPPLLTSARWRIFAIVMVGVAVMSTARIISDNGDLTSSGTFGVALRTAAPIALAGLSGLIAERSGTINIGLEGMMVMGTIFAGWWGWEYGPWMALLGGIIGGMLGGLLMSVATTTFGVNHIVAGVAINLIAPGVARFMASELFVGVQGGSVTSSPGNSGKMGSFTVPFLSGGDLFGWETPDILGWFEDTGWFMVADAAGFMKGMTTAVTWDVLLTIGLFFGMAYFLWHTPLGLRLRFSGERPSAAASLGVSVHKMRYIGMAISGGLAGMGGAVLVLFANRYQENQVAGRGFLGLATMIFGNWMPAGTAAGAGLFGYAQGITLRTNPADVGERPVPCGGNRTRGDRDLHGVPPLDRRRRHSDRVLAGRLLGLLRGRVAEQPARLRHAVRGHADRRLGRGPTAQTARRGRHTVVQGDAVGARP